MDKLYDNEGTEQEEAGDDGMESPSQEEQEAAAILEKYQTNEEQTRWVAAIDEAKAFLKKFHTDGATTIQRYSGERDDKESARYNLLFANAELKLANYFSQDPNPDVKRTFNDPNDDVSRVASTYLQRNLVQELRTENFGDHFHQVLFDMTLPGMGVAWVSFEEEEREPVIQPSIDPVTQQPVGTPVPGTDKRQCAPCSYVAWDDFIYEPGTVWSQVGWLGKRTPMSKPDMEAMFTNEKAKEMIANIKFEAEKTKSPTSAIKPKASKQKTVDVYELWDKENRLVWWIVEGQPYPLDVKEDTVEDPNFFPTPLPPLGRFHTGVNLPISDYQLVRGLYNQLDDVEKKITRRVRSLQTKFVYDAAMTELADLLNDTSDMEGIAVQKWAALQMEKGGLKSSFEFLPFVELIESYQQLLAIREQIKQQIYEIEGLPDLMRGESQQYDSAAATQTKAAFGASRTEARKREIAQYAAKLLRLKAHRICKFVDPEIIKRRAGTLPETDQQYADAAIALLKNEGMESFNLDVSVDSLQAPNWEADQKNMVQAVTAVSQLIGQSGAAAAQDPALAEFVGRTAQMLVSRFRGVGAFESYLDDFVNKKAQETAQKAGQPPKPTADENATRAAQITASANVQVAQIKEESKQQIAQFKAAQDERDAQWERRFKELELQLKNKKIDTDAAAAATENQIHAMNAAHNNALDVAALYAQPTGGR